MRRKSSTIPFTPISTPFNAPTFPLPLTRPITKSYLYFTIPLFMGVIVFLLIISVVLMGVYGVGLTQTPQRWADPNDKCLQVPLQ